MDPYLNTNIARSEKKAGRITGKHITNEGSAIEDVRIIGYAMKPKARRVSYSLFINSFLAIMLLFLTDVSFAEQSSIVEAAPGQPVRTILTLGGDSSEITVQVPANITDWVLDPTKPLCTRESTIVIDYQGPWRVMVSADGPSQGYMAEYDTSSSAYVSGGIRLKNPMIVMAKGGNKVDISHGGVLLEGEGKATIPITFIQEASLEDKPLPAGHIYRINIIFTGLERNASALMIEKTASDKLIRPGGLLAYTITYENSGNDNATNVTITDIVDNNLNFVPADSNPRPSKIWMDLDGTHLWWNASILKTEVFEPGGSGEIQFNVSLPSVPEHPAFDWVYNDYKIDSDQSRGELKTLATPVIHSLFVRKKAEKGAYSAGEIVNYTIIYGNDLAIDADNAIVTDVLPDVEYIEAEPQPTLIRGNVLVWNIGKIPANGAGRIQLYAKIWENCSEMSYKSSGSVSGEGFVNIRQNLDTSQKTDRLINKVNITGYYQGVPDSDSSSATILLTDALGTAVNIKGHGSGTYQREDINQMLEKNRSIKVRTSLSETYHPTTFALPNGRSIKYSSKFSEAQTGKNRISGATLSEVYMYANKIKRDSSIFLDKNGSTLSSDTSFEGAGHIDVSKKDDASCKTVPTYESHEDYLGSFKVNTKVDEYGKNIVTNRSVAGTGMAASDKWIRNSQRSYESGTGSYNVDDSIETQTNYMAKDMNVSYAPVSYTCTPDVRVNLSNKWEEGMSSESGTLRPKDTNSNNPASYIGEKYSGLDYLKKKTVAKGLTEMDTEVQFSGKAEFTVVKASNSNNSSEVNMYDLYIGKYKISRQTVITGVARYDEPHLTITKEGKIAPPVCSECSPFVDYKITVVNDGNQALEPVYVLDYFPPGTTFVSSSLRPTELGSNYSRWTLTNLGIGSRSEIDLRLKAEGVGSLVNQVRANGGYNNTWVSAENYSALRKGWLSCNIPQLLAAKEGYVDSKDNTLVHYRIYLKNRLNGTMAIRVTDQLPGGIEFVNSTTTPASYQPNQVIWNIINIKPGENRTIDYLARALQRGTFVNQAHIEASYRNGGATVETDITSSVNVGGGGSYSSAYSGWQPPACFGLNCTQQGSGDEWIPCYSCGESEPKPIGGTQPLDSSCASCVSFTGVDDNEMP